MEKIYLGDSVYAEIENGMVKLTTNNGDYDSNTIFLEPQVLDNLYKYVEAAKFYYANKHEKIN